MRARCSHCQSPNYNGDSQVGCVGGSVGADGLVGGCGGPGFGGASCCGVGAVVKPRVLWRLVYLVPVVAGCDCSWRWWSWWVSGAQAASCSAGVRIPIAECGRVVLNQWTHSAVATSTASMSSQGPWLRISSALYSELSASARACP